MPVFARRLAPLRHLGHRCPGFLWHDPIEEIDAPRCDRNDLVYTMTVNRISTEGNTVAASRMSWERSQLESLSA